MTNSENNYINQQVNSAPLQVIASPASLDKQSKSAKSVRLDLKARVGRHHFALLRGYLEGIDLRLLAQRYLHAEGAEAADLRIVKRLLRWTIDELIVLARRHGEFAFARAIDIEPSRIQAAGDTQIPSLDDFRAERDPDGFYSETELLELFRDEFPNGGGNRKEKRNARLRERQNEALRWLETLVAADPQMSDALAGWFPDVLASRLNAVGLITIEELVALINRRGTRWYVTIPKVGHEAAQRILTWLEMNRGSLKYTFGKQVFVKQADLNPADLPQRSPSEDIVPIEYFKPRRELDGSTGINRAINNRSTANTDIEAILLWLEGCSQTGGPTWLSYRREAERFLIWSVIERGKALSSVDEDDCIAYRSFLNDLGRIPPEQWIATYRTDMAQWLGRRGTPRTNEAWRPFDGVKLNTRTSSSIAESSVTNVGGDNELQIGVLSLSSQRQSIIILKNLFSWLEKKCYLKLNPFSAIKPLLEQQPKHQSGHSFNVSDWEVILNVLESQPKDAHYFRLRFTLKFAYETGLRLSELAAAKYGDLNRGMRSQNGRQQEEYTLQVGGQSSKPRTVALPTSLIDEIHIYLTHRGFTNISQIPSDTYLIGRLTEIPASLTSALSRRQIDLEIDKLSARNLHQVLKNFFSHAEREMQATAPESAMHIQNASTNWLRHTYDARATANGIDRDMTLANFDQASAGER